MSNHLLSLTFDPQTFVIAPSFDRWMASVSNDRIVLCLDSTEGQREDFEVKFRGTRTAAVKGLPDGDYTMHACLLDGKDKYKICFSFYPVGRIEEADRIIFDTKRYVEAFLEASSAFKLSNEFAQQDFERRFGVNYLLNQLGHRIDGTLDFWVGLQQDLDLVTTPINHAIIRKKQNLPEAPYFLSFNNGPLIRI